MKNLIKLFSFILIISIMFNACKKDDALTEKTITDPTEQKILDFKAKMENGNKSGETMTIEEAVWNIEAALNYTYCIISEEVAGDGLGFNTDLEEMSFEINVTDGMIQFQDVTEYYNSIKDQMNDLIEAYEYDIVFVNNVNVEIENNVLTAIFFVKFKNMDKALWNISGDWFWGMDLGKCDYSQQPNDLIDQIELWISRNRAVYTNVYYTDLSWEGIFLYEVDNHPNPPSQGCSWCYNIKNDGAYLYHEEYNSSIYNYFDICVSQSDCNIWAYYSNQTLDIIRDNYADPGRHVTGWAFYEHLYLEGDMGDYDYWIGHRVYVWTGVPHLIPENQN